MKPSVARASTETKNFFTRATLLKRCRLFGDRKHNYRIALDNLLWLLSNHSSQLREEIIYKNKLRSCKRLSFENTSIGGFVSKRNAR